ncbi:MAG: FAD:protein FMN transferase [Acidimicrobiia bacterium]
MSPAEAHFSAVSPAEAHFSAVSVAEAHFPAVSVAEAHFSAMGSTAHVLVVGNDEPHGDQMLQHARRRIAELQSRWSRFEADSEIGRLNRQRRLTHLSGDTMALLRSARTAWAATGGLFDPTMAGVLSLLGYDRDFRELRASDDRPIDTSAMGRAVGEFITCGLAQLMLDEDTCVARLPDGAQFDPGGIGKGLAADLVCRELIDAGASGALVNLGGDIRVIGDSPVSSSVDCGKQSGTSSVGWAIDIEHPLRASDDGACIARAIVADGAVASSSTLRRRWTVTSGVAHHLLDPRTGAPALCGSPRDIVASTVVAAEAWWAEALAKALILGGSAELLRGAAALLVRGDGSVELLGDHRRFLVLDELVPISPQTLAPQLAAPQIVVSAHDGRILSSTAARR